MGLGRILHSMCQSVSKGLQSRRLPIWDTGRTPSAIRSGPVLTKDELSEHGHDVHLSLPMSTEEAVASTTTQLLHATLVRCLQLHIRCSRTEGELFAEPRTPEGSHVGVDRIASAGTCRSEGSNVLVCLEFASNEMVELPKFVRTCFVSSREKEHTSMGSE
jgi:hypothetical protein